MNLQYCVNTAMNFLPVDPASKKVFSPADARSHDVIWNRNRILKEG
jgi:hypothetical protein